MSLLDKLSKLSKEQLLIVIEAMFIASSQKPKKNKKEAKSAADVRKWGFPHD